MQTDQLDIDHLDNLKFKEEEELVAQLLLDPALDQNAANTAVRKAKQIVIKARSKGRRKGVMESFLEEFGLSNSEGLALMCLAEALLRVPDTDTRDDLIAEKISSGNWDSHKGHSDSWLVNASTWGLMLTGRVIGLPKIASKGPAHLVSGLIRESGEPVIRAAIMQAMRIMGEQFVLGRDIKSALKRGNKLVRKDQATHFSFDMLGEGARTAHDAERYFESYNSAIASILEEENDNNLPPEAKSGISVKLSALHPRYEAVNEVRVMKELYPKLLTLCERAKSGNINLCLDAEEADRLVISLKLLFRLMNESCLQDWKGLGLAIQAYQKRALDVVKMVGVQARRTNMRLMTRLVKGAYWDTEIKHAQTEGFDNFPVFTTKQGTDVNYLACARELLRLSPSVYPQFATHNAHNVAAIEILATAEDVEDYEFQRLHGMGEVLFEAAETKAPLRVYAPVGLHQDLLPYLVRRLLENGANTSFVNTFLDSDTPIESVVYDPFTRVATGPRRHPKIPTPKRLYGASRKNSAGVDLSQTRERNSISQAIETLSSSLPIAVGSIVDGDISPNGNDFTVSPIDLKTKVGKLSNARSEELDKAIERASAFQPVWDETPATKRGEILRNIADSIERNAPQLIALMALEAGKTYSDGVSEVREAVDFCRYYANEAENRFSDSIRMQGPAGETNHLSLHGRGVFGCISPWNFPLAIFTGQIAAALMAGNTVIAKPAEQTPVTAFEIVRLFHEAGLPKSALHLILGTGENIGAKLTEHPLISGICFTGGTVTARAINLTLAQRDGSIIPFIAETGGLNGLFVDTTALREQVIDDMIVSAFGSAGQRCSALRIGFLPYDTADRLIEGLIGAMNQLKIGDPRQDDTDIGPVIDEEARTLLTNHVAHMTREAKILHQVPVPESGSYFSPTLIEIQSLDQMEQETFGPILHVIRYDPDHISKVGAELNAKMFGLTLGIHSRLESFQERVRRIVKTGNAYVNRSMIGAVVGVQPFGGERLSGTGPKAGGPNYLTRFATERTVSVNIAAQGGDPELLNL